jgi:predicted PurR-regulated permease PerM
MPQLPTAALDRHFNWTTRRIILATLVVASVVLGFLLVYRFQLVLFIVFTGIVVSMAMAPAVDWLHRHKLPRAVAVIAMYLLLLILLVGFGYVIVPQIIQQTSLLLPRLEQAYQDIRSSIAGSPIALLREMAWQLPPALNFLPVSEVPASDDATFNALNQALLAAQTVLGAILTLAAILLIGFYWTLEGERAIRSLLLPVSAGQRESAREIIGQITERVGGYVRGQGLLALSIFVASLVAYLALGLPAALALALLAGFFELVPVLGPTLGAIPAILVALASAPDKVVWVIVLSALIQFLENNLLAPRIIHKTVGVNPIVTLLAIVAFGALFGFAGILLAIPVAAVIQIFSDRAMLNPTTPVLEEPVGRDRLSKLRYDTQELVVDIRKSIRRKESTPDQTAADDLEDAIEAIALDLDSVVAQVATTENAT